MKNTSLFYHINHKQLITSNIYIFFLFPICTSCKVRHIKYKVRHHQTVGLWIYQYLYTNLRCLPVVLLPTPPETP